MVKPERYQLPFEWRGTSRELGRHVREIREPLYVRTASDAVSYFLNQVYVPFEQFRQEQLYVLLLDQKNRITHDVMVYKGTVNAVNIRTAELFMEAVHFNSPSIIVAHNHPSGDPTPSPEDVVVTGTIYEAGKLLDIHLLDHLVIGRERFVSLRAQNLGFPKP
jgi:DNA repair protein RadC